MSTTTYAPKRLDPSASLHAEALGQAESHGRLAGRRIIVVGAGQRQIIDEDPPVGNGRAMSVLFAREGSSVACIDVDKEAADSTVAQITSEGGKAFAVTSTSRTYQRLPLAWIAAPGSSAGSMGWRSMSGFRRDCRCPT